MSKIKVVRIIDRLNIGGPAIHVVILSAGLDRSQFETVLVTGQVCDFEGDMSYLAQNYAVNLVMVPELGRKVSLKNDAIALWKILAILKREKADIVHTHKSKAGAIGRVAAIICRVPMIVHTFHGHVFHSYFGRCKSFIFIQIERLLAKFTDSIITISKLQYKDICHRYHIAGGGKCTIVPLGFDFQPLDQCANLRNKLRNKLNIPHRVVTIGIVGRLTAVKNHAMFIKAASRILQSRQCVKFIVVGDGELKQQLVRQVADLHLSEHIIFAGWITSGAEIYCDLDIVTLTSINEGTPVTIIEAMYCSKPVIATDVGGMRDLIANNENGFLIAKNDIDGFCQAACTLIDSKAMRQQMGTRAHECVRHRYDKTRLINDIEQMYR